MNRVKYKLYFPDITLVGVSKIQSCTYTFKKQIKSIPMKQVFELKKNTVQIHR